MAKILIVDDERAARFGMKKALQSGDYRICEAEDGEQAWVMLPNLRPDIVFLDLNMPRLKGMDLLQRIQQMVTPPLVIVVTAYGSEKIAVEAMKAGAYDYLSKPYEVDELRLITQHALDKLALTRENERLLEEIRLRESFGELIGESQPMLEIYDLIDRVAQTNVTVLIGGESGTGKELVAREIHKRSECADKPFIAMNCAALPENLIESELFGHEQYAFTDAKKPRKGKLEEAHGGTLFLDEIGDMTLNTQAKILRALQESTFERLGGNSPIKVDVRFIAATNKDLPQEIDKGNFREDLYYRIKVVDIYLPPLRERITDIPCLTKRFLDLFSRKHHRDVKAIDSQALQKMMSYNWPGNVRELKNMLEKSIVLSREKELTLDDLPIGVTQQDMETRPLSELSYFLTNTQTISFKEAKRLYVREFERQFLTQRLRDHSGNISQTAQALDMPRQSLQQKLKELGINAREIVGEGS